MTGPDRSAVHDFAAVVAAMFADPDVAGDVLVVGVWLARAAILDEPAPGSWTTATIAEDLFGPGTPRPVQGADGRRVLVSEHVGRVNAALRADLPTGALRRHLPRVVWGSLQRGLDTARRPAGGGRPHLQVLTGGRTATTQR